MNAKLPANILDFQLHVLTQLLFQHAKRLGHQHQFGIENQRPRQADALLLAAGELLRIASGDFAETYPVENLPDLDVDLRGRQLAHRLRETQVFWPPSYPEESVILEDHANVALVRRQLLDRRITDANFASIGVSKPARIVRGAW